MPEIGQSGSEGGMAFGPSLPLSAGPGRAAGARVCDP